MSIKDIATQQIYLKQIMPKTHEFYLNRYLYYFLTIKFFSIWKI